MRREPLTSCYLFPGGVGSLACKPAYERAYGVAGQLLDKPAHRPARSQDWPPHSA